MSSSPFRRRLGWRYVIERRFMGWDYDHRSRWFDNEADCIEAAHRELDALEPTSDRDLLGGRTTKDREADEQGPLTVETRYRWKPAEEAPEGWRSGASWFDETVPPTLVTIWTDAPKNRSPFLHDHMFIRSYRVVEQRFVTEWKDQ